MADGKTYYYMRLKDNFIDTNEMVVLESLQDGYLYSNILLKLYLRSLRDNGRLMFNNAIPYNPQMIATITRHQIGTVERALKIFQEMGLIEILDSGAIYMLNIQNYIGKASTEADRQREYYRRIASEKSGLPESKESCKKPYKESHEIPTPEIETEERDKTTNRTTVTTREDKEIESTQSDSFSSSISLPTLDIPFIIYPKQIERLSQEYPNVNVPAEIEKMRTWLEGTPGRLKPVNCMNDFMIRWLASNQSSHSKPPAPSTRQPEQDEETRRFIEASKALTDAFVRGEIT